MAVSHHAFNTQFHFDCRRHLATSDEGGGARCGRNCVGCWTCRRNSQPRQPPQHNRFRCSCRGPFWPACGAAIRPTRCCARFCRWIRKPLRPTGFTVDPVGDGFATLQPGLLQKYYGRALMVTTGACAVHCRYCFRRHFPYEQTPHSWDDWQAAIEQIEADDTLDRSDPQRRRSADAGG